MNRQERYGHLTSSQMELLAERCNIVRAALKNHGISQYKSGPIKDGRSIKIHSGIERTPEGIRSFEELTNKVKEILKDYPYAEPRLVGTMTGHGHNGNGQVNVAVRITIK